MVSDGLHGFASGTLQGAFEGWISLVLLVLCWSPVLVAYFPGITGYDMDFQIYQIVSGNYSSHHPLLHTLFIEAFYRLGAALGSPSLGYGLYTLMQALLLACSIAYATAWLASIGCPRGLQQRGRNLQQRTLITIKDVLFRYILLILY